MSSPPPNPTRNTKLVDGHPEEKQLGGARHSGVGVRLIAKLWAHVEANRLGGVYGPDATFKIGQNERLPDVRLFPLLGWAPMATRRYLAR